MTGSLNHTKLPAGDQEGAEGCKAVTGSHTTSLAILGRHLHAICRYMAPEPTADGEPALEGLTEYPSDQVCEPVTP